MKPLTTTLNAIRAHDPCESSWRKLLNGLRKTRPDDKPLRFSTILRLCGLEDALWAFDRLAPNRIKRLLAVRYAREVQHLMKDKRSLAALDVAERHASGEATNKKLNAASIDAWRAARDAWDTEATEATEDAVKAAGAAWAAGAASSTGAAYSLARIAARASDATAGAARAAGDAARKKQTIIAKAVLDGKPIPKLRKPSC